MLELSELKCLAPVGDRCGEGAVWHPTEQALYWTDINRFLIHRIDPKTRAVVSWIFSEPVTSMNLTDHDDTLLVVFGSKAQFWQPATHTLGAILFHLPTWPVMRSNEARVDPRGSLWIGSMRNNVGPDGEDLTVTFDQATLYRVDPDSTVTEWKHDIGISNTLAWSPERDRMYFGDSIANAIYVWDYNATTGEINRERPFLIGAAGAPDGSAMDAEGCLWNTRPHAGEVVRVAPDGTIVGHIKLPVPNPTTCAFGGDNLSTLFITTAGTGERLAGSLFAIRTNVSGLPENRFHMLAAHISSAHDPR